MPKCTCKKGVAKKCSSCRPKRGGQGTSSVKKAPVKGRSTGKGMRAISRKLKPTKTGTGMRATSKKLPKHKQQPKRAKKLTAKNRY